MGYLEEQFGIKSAASDRSNILAQMEYEESQYAPERGTTMDILRNLAVGTGRAIKLTGDAFESESISDFGQSITDAPSLRPDVSQYFGTQGRLGRVVDIVTESAPVSLGVAGVTAAGGLLAGAPGAYLAGSAALGVIGKGTYEQAYKEISEQRPDLDEDSKVNYGLVNAAFEVGSEAVPFGGFLIGKAVSKPAKKAALNALMDSKVVVPEAFVSTMMKTADPKSIAAGMFGSSGLDGFGEVVTELGQAAQREKYGLELQPVDLIDVFLAGMLPSGVVTGGTVAIDARKRSQVKANVERGLTSEIPEVREDMASQVSEGLARVHPELQKIWDTNVGTLVKQGPVDLRTAIGERQEEQKSTLEKIVEDPQAIINKRLGESFKSNLRTPEVVEQERLEELNRIAEEQRIREKYAPQDTTGVQEAVEAEVALREKPKKLLYEGITDEDYLLVTESKLGVKPSDFKILQDTDVSAAESVKTSLQRISQYKQELSQTVIPEEREILDKKIKSETRRVDNEFKNIGIDYKRVEPKAEPKVELRPDQLESLVDITLFDTENKKPMKMKAKDALKLIDEDLEIYQKLLKCVKGVA